MHFRTPYPYATWPRDAQPPLPPQRHQDDALGTTSSWRSAKLRADPALLPVGTRRRSLPKPQAAPPETMMAVAEAEPRKHSKKSEFLTIAAMLLLELQDRLPAPLERMLAFVSSFTVEASPNFSAVLWLAATYLVRFALVNLVAPPPLFRFLGPPSQLLTWGFFIGLLCRHRLAAPSFVLVTAVTTLGAGVELLLGLGLGSLLNLRRVAQAKPAAASAAKRQEDQAQKATESKESKEQDPTKMWVSQQWSEYERKTKEAEAKGFPAGTQGASRSANLARQLFSSPDPSAASASAARGLGPMDGPSGMFGATRVHAHPEAAMRTAPVRYW